MSLAHTLYRIASALTTGKIIASGNPRRIARHVARRTAFRLSSVIIRWLFTK